ncbi:MAG: RNA methyltransferase [Rhizonema sp. PD38]|nr:RNA methyltransferase [Rhizonema sp. PD38]
MALDWVKIILVESAGPINVGSVARVMKNFGLNHLVLVNPQCDHLGVEAQKMAVHAKDILESAVLVNTLPEALQGCTRAIATTARIRDWETPLLSPRTALPWLLEEPQQPAALIFGREDRGLSNEELNYAQRFVNIPTSSSYSSLNLATAVAICCYELAQGVEIHSTDNTVLLNKMANADEEISALSRHSGYESAPLDVLEAYYQQLESLLLDIGYLYPHTAASRMEKFRQLYNRTQLQTREVAMLRGILRQVEWVIANPNNHEKS